MGIDLKRRKTGPKPLPPEKRFWPKVREGAPDECWEWQGSRLKTGYGQFAVSRSRAALAHRMSWELANGPIPDGMHVLHHCDNPPCVNPAHLFLGSNEDNIADRVAKGRSPAGRHHWTAQRPNRVARGSRSGTAKLSEADAGKIRELRRAGYTQQEIADRFGVSRATVYLIQENKRWISSARQS